MFLKFFCSGPGVFLDSERGKIGKKTMQRSMLIAHREMMPHSRPRRWQCWPAGLLKMPKQLFFFLSFFPSLVWIVFPFSSASLFFSYQSLTIFPQPVVECRHQTSIYYAIMEKKFGLSTCCDKMKYERNLCFQCSGYQIPRGLFAQPFSFWLVAINLFYP